MALYTLKSREEAMLPLLNYSGNDNWVRSQMAAFGGTPMPQQTQVYSALGRTTGAEGNGGSNFFEKRGRSIENAFGTTGAALASTFADAAENRGTENLLNNNRQSLEDIVKKYGYNNQDDFWDQKDQAEKEIYGKYGYDINKYWDDRSKVWTPANANSEAVRNLDAERDRVIAGMNDEDAARIRQLNSIESELRGQSSTNAKNMDDRAKAYEDYRKNNYISQKINQDRGKFAGSAINTLSTAADVTGLSSTPLSNAIQGGIEGVADELEQNGLENFDWGRAGQNALIGATTGAVTGALNKGISNSLAKNGGNLFKGGNALTRGLNNLGSKTALGRVGSTLATGAARGAVSGAVGGATGAGLQSALNGVEFGQGVQNALQGAVQGAQQGAVTGGIMAGANAAFGKTNFGKQLQNAKTNWDQSGSNFDERLTNTLTSGDSAVGDWLMNKRQSNVLGAAGNLGNSVRDMNGWNRPINPEELSEVERAYAYGELTPDELVNAYNNGEIPETAIADMWGASTPEAREAINAALSKSQRWQGEGWGEIRGSRGPAPFRMTETTAGGDNQPIATKRVWAKDGKEYDTFKYPRNGGVGIAVLDENGDWQDIDWSPDEVSLSKQWSTTPTTASLARGAGYNNEAEAWEAYAKYKNDLAAEEYQNRLNSYNAAVEAKNGDFSYNDKTGRIIDAENKYIPPKYSAEELNEWLLSNQQAQTPTTAKGWAKQAGQRIVEDLNNSNLGNRVKDVSSDMPEDIRNMQIRDYNANADGEAGSNEWNANNWTKGSKNSNTAVKRFLDTLGENNQIPTEDYAFGKNASARREAIAKLRNEYTDTELASMMKNETEPVLRALYADAGGQNDAAAVDSLEPILKQQSQVDPWDRVAQEAGYSNYDEVLQRYAEANPNVKINPRGMAGQVLTWMDQNPNTPTTASGWAKRAGQRAVEDVNNSNLGLRVQDVSQDDPSKQLYNALAGNRQPVAETEVETEATVVPSKTSAENKWRYAKGKDLLAQYGTVDAPMARATKAVETFQKLSDMGFEKPADVESISNAITGANGYASTLNKNVIKSAKPVDTFSGDNGQTIDDFVDNSIEHNMLSGTNQGVAVKRSINAYLRSLPSRAEGSVDFEDSAADTFKVVQGLEARAAELEGRGGSTYHRATTEDLHQAAVLKDVARLLKDRIYDGADAKVAITPKVVNEMKALAPGNEKWAATVDDFAKNVKTPQDIRSFQEPFVKAGRYIDNQYVQAATVGGRMAANAGELPDTLRTTKAGIINDIANRVWNSSMAHRGRAALYGKLADRAAEKAAKKATNNPTTAKGWTKQAGQRAAEDLGKTNLGNRIQDVSGQPVNPQVATPTELANTVAIYNPSTQLYNAIGRTEGALAQETPAQYLANAAQEAEIVSPMGAPTAPTNDIATSMGNASTATYNALTGTPTTTQRTSGSVNTGYYQPTGDYWTDIIASAMSAAIDADDVNAFTTLYGMYQDQMANLKKQTSSEKDYSNPMNWSSADRTKLLSAQNAMGQIDQLEEAYNQATGGEGGNAIQGWLRSRASDISGGNWDPSASNYNSLSESVGMGIVKNLINLGVTEADAQRYLKYLPALTDTKEQAAQKLDTLRGIYQNQINNLYGAYGL